MYNKINSNSTRHKPLSLLDAAALTSASGSFSNVANANTRSDLVTSGPTAFCNYTCKHEIYYRQTHTHCLCVLTHVCVCVNNIFHTTGTQHRCIGRY